VSIVPNDSDGALPRRTRGGVANSSITAMTDIPGSTTGGAREVAHFLTQFSTPATT